MQTCQSLIALLDGLLRAPVERVEEAVDTALAELCAILSLSQAAVYMQQGDGQFLRTSHTAPGPAEGQIDMPATLPAERILPLFRERADDLGGNLSSGAVLSGMPDASGGAEGYRLFAMTHCAAIKAALVVAQPHDSKISADNAALLGFVAELMGNKLALRETEMRRVEEKRHHEQTLASLPEEIFEVDAEGNLTGLLAGKPHLLSQNRDAIAGKPLREVLEPAVFRIVDAAFKEALSTGNLVTSSVQVMQDQSLRHYEVAAQVATRIAGGRVSFVVRDVTSNADLHKDLSTMAKIVESMDNLVSVLDPKGHIVWINAAFERHTGWTLPEIKGKRLGKVLRNADSDPQTISALTSKLAAAEPFRGEIINQDRYGNSYWVDFNVVPLFDSTGALSGFVSIETEITRVKQQELATAKAAADAEAAHMRLQNAIHALQDGVVILDAEKRVVAINDAYRQSVPEIAALAKPGVPMADLLQASAEKLFFEENADPAEIEAWVQKRLEAFDSPRDEVIMQMNDGRWIRRINTRTSDGGSIAVGIDVTASRQQIAALDAANHDLTLAMAELDMAKQRLTSLIVGAEVGTWEHDLVAGRLSFRGYADRILGYEVGTLENLSVSKFLALVHPEDRNKLPPPSAFEISGENTTAASEFRMRHRAGHWVWILSRGSIAQRSADGRAEILSGVNIDISERKVLEDELSARRAFLTQVINASVSGLVVLDVKGNISFVNLEAARLLGGARDLIVGEKFEEVVLVFETPDGDFLPRHAMPDAQVRQNQQPLRDFRLVLRLATGEKRALLCNAAPLMQGDKLTGVVMAFSDITDDLAVTKRLEEALVRAEEMSRAKSVFLANMSHEIRTPLNGVLGMAEVLSDLVTEPTQKRMVTTIRKSGETLLTVLNSILDMSKIEAGRMDLEVVPFVPSALLRQLDAIYGIAAEEKGISFEVLTSVGSDQARMGDPHRLMQIFNNLLSNAIKFTDTGSVTLKVSCKRGKPLVIEVTDTGLGMNDTQIARVFDSFEQADGSITRRFGGTGLGLSIVRQLVVLMGGQISVESQVGQGSTFRVVLPLPEAENVPMPMAASESAAVDKSEAAAMPLAGLRVLCADDNATNRLVLSTMLAKTGLVLEFVEDGAKAVAAWTRAQDAGQPFDLLCLDITMPVMDGMTALAHIRQAEQTRNLPPVPAIAVTAHAMPNQVSDYIIGGFDTHLPKPYKQQDLTHAITSLLMT